MLQESSLPSPAVDRAVSSACSATATTTTAVPSSLLTPSSSSASAFTAAALVAPPIDTPNTTPTTAIITATTTTPKPSPPSPARPPLVRQAARNGHESSTAVAEPTAVTLSPLLEPAGEASDVTIMEGEEANAVTEESAPPRELPSGDELKRLRDAVNMKFRLEEQRARLRATASTKISSGLGSRRVSPIKEEPATISPSLDAAFSSPIPTGFQTASTESTESNRTVKGSVPPTPSYVLRTPSYPFPYVPTPKGWPPSFHQPFTTLSPTGTAAPPRDSMPMRESSLSEVSTPAASVATFLPGGNSTHASEDDQFPMPNLYELVLLINSEPGLDNWWQVLVKILRDWYGAERASLAMPADAADLENVPWGQKATYNQAGINEYRGKSSSTNTATEQKYDPLSASRYSSFIPESVPTIQTANVNRARPKLETRHSYAGYEGDRTEIISDLPKGRGRPIRPHGPVRTASHAPRSTATQITAPSGRLPVHLSLHNLPQFQRQPPQQETSFSDPEFSSHGGEAASPYISVFPVLKALDKENDPLVDSSGINQILHRGKMVTLTRDYAATVTNRRSSASGGHAPNESETNQSEESHAQAKAVAQLSEMRARARRVARSGGDYFAHLRTTPKYEEYEQFPSSPWQQSPAPSPAIQADPEKNPFFSGANVEEESFNPSNTTEDYSRISQVEAIGVDSASTVIHLPLYHPVYSQPRHSTGPLTSAENPEAQEHGSVNIDPNRAPIAILSVLAHAVPYPQSLAQSLKLLGPHIATACYNAQLYSLAVKQASSRSRLPIGPRVGFAAGTAEVDSLDDVLRINMDELNESAAGSMTSPSDYSGRSRHSPGGSMGGTPGWDHGDHGIPSKRSISGTPAPRTDLIDSYFDAKKQAPISRSNSHTSLAQAAATAQAGRDSPSSEPRPPSRRAPRPFAAPGEDDTTPRNESRPKRGSSGREDTLAATSHEDKTRPIQLKSPQRPSFRTTPSHQGDNIERRQHSQLHSYGASFATNFPSLPVATTPGRGPAHPQHVRGNSTSEHPESMPAPSERLLRTITDALPVQIFIAEPNTGSLAWVNSKFLVYRGQEPGQILKDPWGTIHPEDRSAYMESWERSLRTGQQFSHKVRLKRFDGHYRWFYVRATPLRNPRQSIVHWAGTNMDFHEQHLAEMNSARQQETAASEAKYRALANSSPQIVFAVTNSKGVTFCNSQWLYYSGQTEAEAKGVGFMDYVHPDDLSKCRLPDFSEDGSTATNVPTSLPVEPHRTLSGQGSDGSSETVTSPGSDENTPIPLPQSKLSELASTGILKVTRDAEGRPSYSTEVRLRSKDDQYRWHLVRILLAQKVPKDDETEETWYGTCTDINDHKLLEQTLKETMDAKSRFLSNMSHEIRTPLNGITGMVNLLIDSNLTSEAMEHVNVIRNCTEGLRSLINDILDLSKVEAGMINLNMDWLNVRSLIEEIQDVTGTMAIDKGLELNYLVEEDLPLQLKGDRFRIRQVLLNVVGNAIKFTDHGEVFVRCQSHQEKNLTHGEKEMFLLFEVIDSGRGFTEKEAEFLFKRFSQIDGSSTRQHGGTGLGLAISMQLVELHGGKMKATSVPGKGSTFTFSIKFGMPSVDDRPETETEPASQVETPLPTPGTPNTVSESSSLHENIPLQSKMGTSVPGVVLLQELTESPAAFPDPAHPSPQESSASSDPSIQSSLYSSRSSQSSSLTDHSSLIKTNPISLQLPSGDSLERATSDDSSVSAASAVTVKPDIRTAMPAVKPPLGIVHPTMYHILVVCPLPYARMATIQHIEMTLPKSIPHQITAPETVDECLEVLSKVEPLIFTHIVLVLRSVDDMIRFMDLVLGVEKHAATTLVIISDLAQKRDLEKQVPRYDFEKLEKDGRIRIIWKPLKPSKIGVIFDPQKQREMSTDVGSENVHQVAKTQKQLFAEIKARLGNKGYRVLLVEDNETNVKVIIRFLERVQIHYDVVGDGVQCTETVFAKEPGYYSIILCDLHMPNKDGYQTCKEIRLWEKANKYAGTPIVALSANVLDDVWLRCVEAGFNSYMSKPVDFRELASIMTKYLEPEEPGKPHKLMKARKE